MNYIEIKAPAKINIGLKILNKRSDGYHNLSTLFYPLNDIYDELTFRKSDHFSFHCSDSALPLDEGNLVVRAVRLLEQRFERKFNISIELSKNIPSGGGLGGGSSDAAATLLSIKELFDLPLTTQQLIDLSLTLGSDVPFFIKSKPAIGTSRGEILEQVELEIEDFILVVNPGINISTKEAFNNISPGNAGIDFFSFIKNGKPDYELMKVSATNDFESYVYTRHPEIGRIKEELYRCGALFALLSGSGSSVYGIFKTEADAKKAVNVLPKNYFCRVNIPDY